MIWAKKKRNINIETAHSVIIIFLLQSVISSARRSILNIPSCPFKAMSKIVQDYMLVEVIGSGQYGKVWKAQHIKTREPYAIKSISIKQISGVEKLREFVMSEISALEQMSNRNIVKYFGKLQTTNNIYLIFEFCNGGTLEDVIKKEGMIAEGRAMPMFDQILNAFSELHRLNIMHRDIKPSNILLEKGEIKLADFGFCKKMKGEFEMTKSIVGSPIYMAPELLQGRYYCTKADIWSLGVMLYEMLHGKCPYEENSIPTLLEKIKSSELRVSPGLSLETKQLLEGMLTFNPSSRISWNDLFRRLKSNDFYRSGVPSMSNTYVNTSQPPEQPTSYSYVPTTDSSLQTRVMGITNNPDPRIRDQAKLTPTPQSALDYDPLRKKAPSTMPMGSNPMGYYDASQNNSSLDTTAQLGQRPVPSYTGQPSSLGSTIPMQKPSQPSVAPRTAPDSLATAGRPR
jgi:serine/threonine protein kinase